MMTSIELLPVAHLVGFLAAIAVYAMLLVMVWRVGLTEATRLPLAAGVLGLLWNLGSLGMFALPELGLPKPPEAFDALAYTALGLLPAAVVHSVLIRQKNSVTARWLIAVAYTLSGLAGLGHFSNVMLRGFAPFPPAVHRLGPVYGLLILPLALLTRHERSWARALWMLALALFAVTGTTLAHHNQDSLLLDLVGHHASLLLAFVILYQEYRFALADLFLKRALAWIALVSIAMAGYLLLMTGATGRLPPELAKPRTVALVVTLWVGTALLYPTLRTSVSRLVDALILGRDHLGGLRADIATLIASGETSSDLLAHVSTLLGQHLGASSVHWMPLTQGSSPAEAPLDWMEQPPAGGDVAPQKLSGRRRSPGPFETVRLLDRASRALLLVPTTEPPRYVLSLGRLSDGRRLSGEDTALLEWLAFRLAQRIDQLRTVHERYEHALHEQEMRKLTTEAELRALRAQLNPHFLFNALTTIGHLIQTTPERAMDALMNLTDLLRRVLRSNEQLTTLGEEIDLIGAYLAIEQARFEERLQARIDVPKDLRSLEVPPLILQPLVENCVNHGIAPTRSGGRVTVEARLEEPPEGEPLLMIRVRDTGQGATAHGLAQGRRRGLGLRSVEGRLRGHYGERASMSVSSRAGSGTCVEIRLPSSKTERPGVSDDPMVSHSGGHR